MPWITTLRPRRILWIGSAKRLGLDRKTESVSSITTAVEPISFVLDDVDAVGFDTSRRFCAIESDAEEINRTVSVRSETRVFIMGFYPIRPPFATSIFVFIRA
jgi:hypothetical protein